MIAKWIGAAAMLTAGTVSVEASSKLLPPNEINGVFGTGTPFTAVGRSGGKAYWFTLKSDGSAYQVPKGKTSGATGTWRLSDNGYCTKWGTGKEHCYTVEKSGINFAVRDSSGNLISTWTPVASIGTPALSKAPAAISGAYADGTFSGPVENAYYGLVQIEAIVQRGALIGIKVLQYPSDRSTSVAINRRALPILREEVVSAQTANVDIVSGATLTSKAFIQSLGAALKEAKL